MKQQNQVSSGETVTCGFCGGSRVNTRFENDEFLYGEGVDAVVLSATIPVHQCEACGAQFTGDAAEDIRHEAVCNHLGVLTPSEIRQLRERHHLSRGDFAKLTRIGEATIARWERGALIQNAGYDQLLRLLQLDDNIQWLQSARSSSVNAVQPTQIAQFRYLTVDETRLKEQAQFKLRKIA